VQVSVIIFFSLKSLTVPVLSESLQTVSSRTTHY